MSIKNGVLFLVFFCFFPVYSMRFGSAPYNWKSDALHKATHDAETFLSCLPQDITSLIEMRVFENQRYEKEMRSVKIQEPGRNAVNYFDRFPQNPLMKDAIFGLLMAKYIGDYRFDLVRSILSDDDSGVASTINRDKKYVNHAIHGCSPLHYAVFKGNCSAIKTLIQAGASINRKDCHNKAPLYYAMQQNEEGAARCLLSLGAPVQAPIDGFYHPLVAAVQMEKRNMVQLLLEHGADPNNSTSLVRPLQEAAWHNVVAIVADLLDAGADVNGVTPYCIQTPLYRAIDTENESVVDLLIARNADVNTSGLWGDSPLHAALRRQNAHIVRALLQAGADSQVLSHFIRFYYDGWNKDLRYVATIYNSNAVARVLRHEAQQGNDDALDYFFDVPLNIDMPDGNGDTALMLSARFNHRRVVKILLEHGANPLCMNTQGKTAYEQARRGRRIYHSVRELLKDAEKEWNSSNIHLDEDDDIPSGKRSKHEGN